MLLAALSSLARAQLEPLFLDRGGVGLGLALRRLGVTGRVLYVTAHPDDEHNGALVRLSRGRGLRIHLLTLTRGEGGQNEVGPELYDALGVLRTEELLAVHRSDGVEQSFGRAVDFGYSYSVEETFAKWGKEEALGDVVRALRAFRPDVVLTLPLDAREGGLHHQAAARLAAEAFRAAADPARFPEQVRAGLRPWQAAKIYQAGVGGSALALPGPSPVVLSTAAHDPLLGMSAQELGSRARTAHRSQRVSHIYARPGQGEARFALVDSEPKVRWPEADILQGIDTSLVGLSRFASAEPLSTGEVTEALRPVQSDLERAQEAFDTRAPEKTAPLLAAALGRLRAMAEDLRGRGAPPDLLERLEDEERELVGALTLAHGLAVQALTDDPQVVPGQRFGVSVTVWNEGALPVAVDAVELRLPPGWSNERLEGVPAPLPPGQSLRLRYATTVAEGARPTQPFWRRAPGRDRHRLEVPACEGLPFCPPEAAAVVRFRSSGVVAEIERPVLWPYEGPVGGEKQVQLQVVPALSVQTAPSVVIVPRAAPRPVTVTVLNNRPGPALASVRLMPATGWKVEPRDAPLTFQRAGEAAATRFSLEPPSSLPHGSFEVRAAAEADGRAYEEGAQVVAYAHLQERRLYKSASARVLSLDVRVRPGTTVGYVMGTGDEVPAALTQLGVPVRLLDGDDLAFGDLSRFSAVVLGIRAYEARPDLVAHHPRLLRYVREGGHLVVQYNRLDFNLAERPRGPAVGPPPDSPFAPYPAAVSARRVTDEAAPVTVLSSAHPLLTTPNRITADDWQGWIQERGLHFLDARDPRYVELLSMRDPFPLNPGEQKGALVEAKVGKGTWTYVALGLFRQLPAGTPGAYRLLANLVSRPPAR